MLEPAELSVRRLLTRCTRASAMPLPSRLLLVASHCVDLDAEAHFGTLRGIKFTRLLPQVSAYHTQPPHLASPNGNAPLPVPPPFHLTVLASYPPSIPIALASRPTANVARGVG